MLKIKKGMQANKTKLESLERIWKHIRNTLASCRLIYFIYARLILCFD